MKYSKRDLILVAAFWIFILSSNCFADPFTEELLKGVFSSILSPRSQYVSSPDKIDASKISHVHFSFKEEEISKCKKLGEISTAIATDNYKLDERCSDAIARLSMHVARKDGDTLFIHPMDYDCRNRIVRGTAYKCRQIDERK